MLTEDLIARKRVGCLDLVMLVFALESQGAKYKINDDGSLTVYNPNFIFIHDFRSHKLSGLIYNAHVEGSFTIERRHGEVIFECNEYSTRISLNY